MAVRTVLLARPLTLLAVTLFAVVMETGAAAAVAQGLQDVLLKAGCPKAAIQTEMVWKGRGEAVEITVRCLRETLEKGEPTR